VTHLPQVASRGHHHFRITKRAAAKGSPISELTALDAKERVDEIARMLGNQKKHPGNTPDPYLPLMSLPSVAKVSL